VLGRRTAGCPDSPAGGLTYLSHAFNTSDEETVCRWVGNPYHQYFCGEEYFRHELPIDPSSLSRWRKWIGEQGSELILKLTVQAGLTSGAVALTSLEGGVVDTTVQEKAVTFPTDLRLYNRSRERLVKLAAEWGFVFGRVTAALAVTLMKGQSGDQAVEDLFG
jgi:transposase, IS5 family